MEGLGLSSLLKVVERLMHFSASRRDDKRRLFEGVAEPLYKEVERCVEDYFLLFRNARDAINSASDMDEFSAAVAEIRRNRERLLHVRRKVTELAHAVQTTTNNEEICNFCEGVGDLFSSSLVREKKFSDSERLVELLDIIELEGSETGAEYEFSTLRSYSSHFADRTLEALERRWIYVCSTYGVAKLRSLA